MLNFIAVCLCLMSACWCGYYGKIGLAIMDIILLLLNLPYAIKWLTKE